MKRTSLLACMAALILLVGGGSTFGANPSSDESGLISVKFAGGTVAEYFEALLKEAGTINVMLAPEVADVSMPPVTLTSVSLSAAIGLVDGRSASPPGRFIKLDVHQMPQFHDGALPTYQVRAEVHRASRRVVATARVWTIASLLRDDVFDADDVLAAVETALDILQSTGEPVIRFHKETGLVIARGDPQQLSAIDDVLGQLQASQNLMSQRPYQKLRDEHAALGGEMESAKARISELTGERDSARDEIRRFRVELEAQMARLAETERMLQQRNQELADLTSLLRKTQAELEAERRKSTVDGKSGRDNP
ncbi:MAG: hypothetical protein IIA64_12410 [Planctomycetes bacterium]|nr:hypothetical protein [Planctomycetota bacterium]